MGLSGPCYYLVTLSIYSFSRVFSKSKKRLGLIPSFRKENVNLTRYEILKLLVNLLFFKGMEGEFEC